LRIVITVGDNGIGFDASSDGLYREKQSYGLFSIRERLSSMGGTLNVQSSKGKGTEVTLEVSMAGEEQQKLGETS
jgi:signal transduction histidine kinase